VDVVVATPGRALDHIRRGPLRLDGVRVVVLDEADEMLDMGFAEDLEAILAATPRERQTMLFSATLPRRIAELANAHLRDPVRIRIERETIAPGEAPRVRQVAYVVSRPHKLAALGRVLDIENPTSVIVFCRTRTEVDELTETLNARGYRAEALHGGLSQEQRDRVMRRFRSNTSDLLIATDVAARGLDVEHVSHVINYDVPAAAEAYVHRIGRTGRAGREGVAITLAEPREHRLLRNIERLTHQTIDVAPIPTVADLRARRLELTRSSLRETLLAGELDGYREVVESLADEFDVLDVAAAAVKQAAAQNGEEAEQDIPAVAERPSRKDRVREDGRTGRGERDGRSGRDPGRRGLRKETLGGRGAQAPGRARERPAWEVAQLWIGAGRKAQVRPGDIVGAISNEVGIDASAIGAIRIEERFSLVEVPEEIADDIVAALSASTIKGKRVTVRRDRESR
jgi:ATP-dependent RNA helicase DeaD